MASIQRSSDEPEQIVSNLERKCQLVGYVCREEQEQLRLLLRAIDNKAIAVRNRVIALLNPRDADVIYLTDVQFKQLFEISNPDNYDFCDIDFADIYAQFDANHGYYVAWKRQGRDS